MPTHPPLGGAAAAGGVPSQEPVQGKARRPNGRRCRPRPAQAPASVAMGRTSSRRARNSHRSDPRTARSRGKARETPEGPWALGHTLARVFEKFTARARRVMVLAQEEAHLLGHNYIGTEHLLLSLIHETEGVAAKALDSFGISLENARGKVEDLTSRPTG